MTYDLVREFELKLKSLHANICLDIDFKGNNQITDKFIIDLAKRMKSNLKSLEWNNGKIKIEDGKSYIFYFPKTEEILFNLTSSRLLFQFCGTFLIKNLTKMELRSSIWSTF